MRSLKASKKPFFPLGRQFGLKIRGEGRLLPWIHTGLIALQEIHFMWGNPRQFQSLDSRFQEMESGFFFSGTGFQLFVGFPIPWAVRFPDSKVLDSGFHKQKLLRFRILWTKIFRIPLHEAQKILSQEPKCNCNYPVVPVSLGFRFSPVFHVVHRYHLYLH